MKKNRKWISVALSFAVLISVFGGANQVQASAEEKVYRKHVVVLDPGHGGIDSGAEGYFNGKTYVEEVINWNIAYYAKKELEGRNDIEVHLTRERNESMGLVARVLKAKQYNADLLVSMHVNASDGKARGASVMISKGYYRPYLAEGEMKFGKFVMEELGKLGIYRRFPETGGMEYRLSENGSCYPNNKPRDYYGIVASSVENNLPGVIIEHAFIDNYSDIKNFLGSTTALKRLAHADANAIIRYCEQLPKQEIIAPEYGNNGNGNQQDGWVKSDGDYYYYKNGKKVTDCLLNLNDGIYLLDQSGRRKYKWQEFGEKTYYFNEDGSAQRGWMKEDDDYFYFNSKYGYMYKDIALVSGTGNVYIFDKQGKRYKNWFEFNGKHYYAGKSGYALRGMQRIDGKYYYFNPVKAYQYRNTKITMSNKDIYYFDGNGVRFEGGLKNLKSGNKTFAYYFLRNGKAVKGWLRRGGNWYYFSDKSGIMLKNTSITQDGKKYKFDSKGICINRKS